MAHIPSSQQTPVTGNANDLKWPVSCKYFNPEVMDAEFAHWLLSNDTIYTQNDLGRADPIYKLDFTGTGEVFEQTLSSSSISNLSPTTIGHLRVLFMKQKRRYYRNRTASQISVPFAAWLDLLDQLMIPPPVLDALHNNNGGFGNHTSYCSVEGPEICPKPHLDCCAYHIWFKLGDWGNFEHFAYARHDFHTGQILVLVLGNNGESQNRRLLKRFQGRPRVHLFSILLALVTMWFQEMEEHRWQLDFATQAIESQTGHSSLMFADIEPLAPEQLSLSKSITVTASNIQNTVTGALNIANILPFLSSQLSRYISLGMAHSEPEVSTQPQRLIEDAITQLLSQNSAQILQMHSLKARVDAQWNIVNALIMQRDSRLNIDIASAMKQDSELMRRIALITMIFLPATFMATFFSMSFFHVGSEDSIHLLVSKWIWLYPLCAIPFTILLASDYIKKMWLNGTFGGGGDKQSRRA